MIKKTIEQLIIQCSKCKAIQEGKNYQLYLPNIPPTTPQQKIQHGYCIPCYLQDTQQTNSF